MAPAITDSNVMRARRRHTPSHIATALQQYRLIGTTLGVNDARLAGEFSGRSMPPADISPTDILSTPTKNE